jgi:membrane protein DedA with SNARE-associated domain
MFDLITSVLERTGYIGVAVLMFVENLFPPIPSELVMPFAGFNAATGPQTLWGVILAGTAGSVAGALFWYWVGWKVGPDRIKRFAARHGRWLTMTPGEIDRVSAWFHRHGRIAVLIGRMLPTVRTLISVPAGVAEMPIWTFTLWTAIGAFGWTALLAVAGFSLESQYDRVQGWLDPVSTAFVAALLLVYLWRVWTFDARRAAS